MIRISRLSFFLAFTLFSASFAFSYQKPQSQAAPPQTPRQALIEMVRGGGEAITKHLTVEMQQALPGGKTDKSGRASASARKSRLSQDSGAKATTDVHVHTTVASESTGVGLVGFNLATLSLLPPYTDKNLETFETGPVFCVYTDP